MTERREKPKDLQGHGRFAEIVENAWPEKIS